MDDCKWEKYSSAVTLSDMEVFIFPELILALALANIMSPIIWEWKEDSWFDGIDKLSPYRRILRVKQYIMQQYQFNLDLETWGLTTKEQECERFKAFVEPETLARSNALFGYEGDKYYFDTNIRKHFGLSEYQDDVIPYWKTETVEAMGAFKYKEGYQKGAGECVSFAALYYAALFVIAKIPLQDMYMMATPLHSQNFIAIGDGIITNNRRIVTKNMWFNGTEISAKARRAIENEKITLIVNHEGYIHTLYEEATLPQKTYLKFSQKLKNYLKTPRTYELFINFLRQYKIWQECFYFTYEQDKVYRVPAECVYDWEIENHITLTKDNLQEILKTMIKGEVKTDFCERLINSKRVPIEKIKMHWGEDGHQAFQMMGDYLIEAEEMQSKFSDFCELIPRIPSQLKKWGTSENGKINIDELSSREAILNYMHEERNRNEVVGLAFAAYHDVEHSPWQTFVKAALERNPVSIEGARTLEDYQVYVTLREYENESIYSENRLAQPDEVWNYKRGDGIEKALCMWNIMNKRYPNKIWRLYTEKEKVFLTDEENTYTFYTDKTLFCNWKSIG